jgi:hypothetical protein
MMTLEYWLLLFFLITIVILLLVVLKMKRKSDELENLLAHSKNKLEDLQVNFGRFAPEEVVEQLTNAEGQFKPTNVHPP